MRKLLYLSLIALTTLSAELTSPPKEVSEYLIRKGIPIKVQEEMPEGRAQQIYDGLMTGKFPTNTVFSQSAWNYSISSAQRNPEFHDSSLIDKIKARLSSKEHIDRSGNESTDLEKLNQVDRHMLSLLSSYIDLFEKSQEWFSMERWFPEGEKSAELGGIVFANKGLEAVLVDTEWQKAYYPDIKLIQGKDVYLNPFIVQYIERIGFIHTHSKLFYSRDYEGPSGDLKCGTLGIDDTTSLTKNARTNPLQMDAVVSWIGERKVNVDVYFRDIEFKKKVPKNKGDVIVVDIGNFEVSR